jgi:phosphate transport system substrate-binding protein
MARVERGKRRTDVLCHMLVGVMFLGLAAAALAEQAALTGRPVVDPAIGSYVASSNVSGAIVITGSDTMYPIMVKVASAFRQWQPDVKLAVQGGGSDAALKSFLQDQALIRRGDADPHPKGHMVSGSIALLASSRPLTSEERQGFQSRYGYEPTEVPVAVDTIAIYVNRGNPIQGLTLEEVDAIFGRDRKRGSPVDMTTWGQVGLKGEWEQQPINVYGRDAQSGTRTFFVNEVLLGGTFKPGVQEERGVALEILAISRDRLGIGYAGIGFQASTVRVVPLAEKAGMPYVTPSAESAANGTYPLSRSLYLYVRKAPGFELEPVILEFLKFTNSRQGQEAVVKAGAYALSAAQVATNFERLTGMNSSAPAVVGGAR